MNQMDPVHILSPYDFQLHFNIILQRSPDVHNLCWSTDTSSQQMALHGQYKMYSNNPITLSFSGS
jgi:hypothetical protein